MTLVVARITKDRIAISADTLITFNGNKLPMQNWALKSICLPGNICVSYSGSPELAAKSFVGFRNKFPEGASFHEAVSYFENSSKITNNDYIIAFSEFPRIVTIKDGRRVSGTSKNHWIGDKDAYEAFREYEHRQRSKPEDGRALNAALFADEMTGSPASDLYSAMRNVVNDRSISTVGGFVTVLSNRDIGFRFSVYSDVLFDWPDSLINPDQLDLNGKIDFQTSGENSKYSVSQISPGYYNMNVVAFYMLKGRLLVVFYETEDGTTKCDSFRNIMPNDISNTLDELFKFPFRAMCLVMSPYNSDWGNIPRQSDKEGVRLGLFCEVNTLSEASHL